MTSPSDFSKAELQLIVELLTHERLNLPSEIHHTQMYSRTMRRQLEDRKVVIDRLLEKLKQEAAA